jgi:isoleucyl-tRNA synthetase
LRWYFFTINDPGDPKNFDEADLTKITRRFLMILYNSFIFWNSYGQGIHSGAVKNPTNVLDRWIAARLNQLISEVTANLERYEIGKAALMIEQFTDDLSRWYIRRSRDRFQSSARGDSSYEADFREASATLQYALATLSKLIAPCMPFFGEALYQSLDASQKSVHLENWPVADTKALNPQLLKDMVTVRELAAVGLALRADAKIKVRQPLASLTVKDASLKGKDELIKILLDEVNVKEVLFDAKLTVETGAVLDTVLTAELREEGIVRELTRAVSGLRADAGYQMGDEILLMIASDDAFSDLVQRQSLHIKKAVNAKLIELKKSDKVDAQLDTKVGEVPVWIGVRKV